MSNNLIHDKYNFINDISLFPIHEVSQYYDTFYIDESFKDLEKLKFLFGGPRQYISYTYNFSDGTHDELFNYMINNSEIPKYEAKAKKIIDDITAQIVWIE